jgi:ABC-type glycerol-3-phosphate transport system substrate-binding protein
MVRYRRKLVVAATALLAVLVVSAPAAQSKKTVTLEVWDYQAYGANTPFGNAFKQINDEFMAANPNIKIKFVALPNDRYEARLRAAIASKKGPDVFTTANFGDEFFDGIVPLDSYVTPAQKRRFLAVDPRVSAAHKRTLVIPWGLNANLIVYNKKLLRQAGINQAPANLASMLRACDALNNAGITPMHVGMQDGWWIMFFHIVLSAQTLTPKEQFANQAGRLPLTNANYRSALEATIQMYNRGCFGKDALSKTSGDTFSDLNAGKTAMRPDNKIQPELFKDLGADNVDFVLYPRLPQSKYNHPVTSAGAKCGIAMTKWADKTEAWKYISFLAGVRGQEILWRRTQVAPGNTAVNVNRITGNPVHKKYLTLLLKTPGIAKYGGFPGFTAGAYDIYVRLAPQVLAGDLSVTEFLGRIEQYRKDHLDD